MISKEEREFVLRRPLGHLGTADAGAAPHVMPVCFALEAAEIFIPIDEKPKGGDIRRLKRLRNIADNPRVCLMVDRYDPDWSGLGWVMLRGAAAIWERAADRAGAIELLRARYVQYQSMDLETRPLIVIRVDNVSSWGDLSR
ncbi:TIGR03668 family PPOX class F420-dependent oxidoreductase [Minwuia thermotolerans]|uniref:TIGR03668 family PPOX class F420-dependent oxidoreductase n=1 Tax=Minwuia thermotolerans TaxID=2056226 RepID=A0A2M9G366_9PROT|nr:TIGR03668 family PPOX class F420-dependent oxidoreductase [Minwuia thermotolerans]PJK30134.1 TIGR03668 family PPOX class F420-dependent oxidoreductase [Minwuia thermotolerans]